jgi:hypothetical protein
LCGLRSRTRGLGLVRADVRDAECVGGEEVVLESRSKEDQSAAARVRVCCRAIEEEADGLGKKRIRISEVGVCLCVVGHEKNSWKRNAK